MLLVNLQQLDILRPISQRFERPPVPKKQHAMPLKIIVHRSENNVFGDYQRHTLTESQPEGLIKGPKGVGQKVIRNQDKGGFRRGSCKNIPSLGCGALSDRCTAGLNILEYF